MPSGVQTRTKRPLGRYNLTIRKRLRSIRSAAARSTHTIRWQAAITIVACCFLSGGAIASATPHRGSCLVPRLRNLVLSVARERAAHAGCTLRLAGASVKDATTQTVRRQAPRTGGRGSPITVWLNPLCRGSAEGGGPARSTEPGPSELITGFYLDGGPLARWSSPGCVRAEPAGAGTVQVLNPTTGAVIATQTSTDGQLVTMPLPAGSYTVVGTFADATANGQHSTESMSLQIPPGTTVRQDFVLQIP
jgi:hypothetical protein